MGNAMRALGLALMLSTAPVVAVPVTRDSLARDVGQAEDVRAIKTLQRSYANFAQFGLWREMAALFADDARWIFDTETIAGRAAIGRHLLAGGGGHDGLAPGVVNTMMIETPLINLAPDGRTAKGRWHGLFFQGDGKGHATITGGIYENDYVKQGSVWKIATLHFYPQYTGPYEQGWLNWKGQDLPIVPYHFTPDSAGVPIPPATGPAPRSAATLAALQKRIVALNDEDKVRNLQNAYGYYVDRRMWDDVVDLFADKSAIEIGGIGVYDGKSGVRRAMERMGPQGLTHGQLNDRPLFDTVVTIDGNEAHARGIELGMLGEADKGEAYWEVNVFDNRFVREGGVWKIREMRIFPLIRSDYHQGWARSRLVEDAPTGRLAPDHTVPAADRGSQDDIIPAFLIANPASGRPIAIPAGKTKVAAAPLTGPIPPAPARAPMALAELSRRLAVSKAYDGVENVSTAYGDFLDDFQSPQFSALLAKDGFKVSAFAGYFVGRERVTQAGLLVWGKPPVTRVGISFHWRIQPVINVAADGRSATYHARLFQPRTSKQPAKPYAFYGAGFHSGVYHDQMVLEDGIWRFWNLSLDEPYMVSPDWKGGWSGAKDRVIDSNAPASPLMAKYPPDIPIKSLGARMEHFRGGTGQTIEWPGILPMWFDYRNPVSGRVPEHYTPVCVPCDVRPDLALSAHGYLAPPTGPEPDPMP
ncbi:nuclear transport factor 2 family protein [Sphingomonas sp. MMS24-J13]|uniref:nuclear transport factor 2 family protein n=1 Tax=Sphingomonas sp. MMS24-J13 TaxID=3238686 RepID=UPI00385102CB